ncbi:NADH dehydrogenase [Puccinia sorghi]|uniref:NADH dehydrogenase n=1 Tax=Puccinia sorghi TaxID=27349 RepID=A0A0L6UZE8_9BASI|nr:NADH dehydrogenase [Puccinia sorghi]
MIRIITTLPTLRRTPATINQHHPLLRPPSALRLHSRLFHPTPLVVNKTLQDEPAQTNSQIAVRRFARTRSFLNRHRSLRIIAIGVGSLGVITARHVPSRIISSIQPNCFVCLLGLLAYDATTYSEKNIERVPVQPLALNPIRGGPKNLKIANYLVGDHDDPEFEKLCDKPKLVIVGGGWGAMGLINSLEPDSYHVVLIAPENYNLFTPLLPSATVGTVETRSLIEPLRKLVARVKGHYLQAYAVDVDFGERLVEVKGREKDDEPFYFFFHIAYDKLVISVGSVSNAHGVPGLQYSSQLKTIDDAREIRQKIINNLERASLPSISQEERRRLLSFVVCGGGPTGVEFASELYDMIHEDVLKYAISIHLIQSRDHILNTYSEKISQYAEKRFLRAEIDTILKITPSSVSYSTKAEKNKQHTIPAGFVLWSTGIAMNPLTQKLAGYLPNQYHKHALEVDSQSVYFLYPLLTQSLISLLRVKGAPLGTVYAIGDASTIETNLVSENLTECHSLIVNHLLDLVDRCDINNDGQIDFDEFELMIEQIRRKFPTAQVHIEKVRNVFEKYDSDQDNKLGLNELVVMFQEISNRLTSLPATAQVADQQGKYLGKKFNRFQSPKALKSIDHNQLANSDFDELLFDPFVYRHLGSLACLSFFFLSFSSCAHPLFFVFILDSYPFGCLPSDIGNSAVFDFGDKYGSFAGGLMAAYLVKYHPAQRLKPLCSFIAFFLQWRSIYWSEQVSTRTRALLLLDWIKRGIWGRDISKVRHLTI